MEDIRFMEASGPLKAPLTNDYLFRAMVQRNHRVLIALLCVLLRIGEDTILSARVVNPIILGDDPGEASVIPEIQITYRIRSKAYAGRFPEHLLLYASGIPRVIQNGKTGNPFHEKDWKAFFKAATWEELRELSDGKPVLREAAMTAYELISDEDVLFYCRKYMH
ncbi:MAG: hypothetical protein IJJ13_06505 [Lachnospiraceae bacterium]|nr:hypothetical protein [Lachnospiraceae bacterium]